MENVLTCEDEFALLGDAIWQLGRGFMPLPLLAQEYGGVAPLHTAIRDMVQGEDG